MDSPIDDIVRFPVEKTPLMLEIEHANDDRDVRLIILDAIQSHRTDEDALKSIGTMIDQDLNVTLLSIWVRRLGILSQARLARMRRLIPA